MDFGDVQPVGTAFLPGTTVQADPSSAFPIAGDAGVAYGFGTGQQGISPSPGDDAGSMNPFNAIPMVFDWLNRPFKVPMSPVTLALAVGVVIVAIIFWNFILYHIRIAAETI